jgi:hypothetical protein
LTEGSSEQDYPKELRMARASAKTASDAISVVLFERAALAGDVLGAIPSAVTGAKTLEHVHPYVVDSCGDQCRVF